MSASPPDGVFSPTPGLTYNPNDPQYFDATALEGELARSFDLCHSCRLCFKFCQSFPTLFRAIDDEDRDARDLPQAVTRQVVDECFGCRLCYVNCPYTPDEGHEFQLDFPALLLRARAQRVAHEGLPRRERLLGDPDRLGRQGTRLPVLANACNQNRVFRLLMEKVLGIHRDKRLPPFASHTFEAWFEDQHGAARETSAGTHPVVLFYTCYINYNRPEIGQAAVEVLAHNDCRVACPAVNCCGMPALDGGDLDSARRQARANVERLAPLVERGYRIAAINPTCSLMLKREYPLLLDDPNEPELAAAARRVAQASRDVSEYLFEQRAAGHYRTDYRSTPQGKIAYHVPCHLKAQAIGFRGRDLLRGIPGVRVQLVDRCSGHDGTWAMKKEYFELSLVNGRAACDELEAAEADVWTSDCPLAALQFEQATGRRPLHPIEVLARAYRGDGFAHRLEEPPPPAG